MEIVVTWNMIASWAMNVGSKILIAIICFFFGLKIIKWLMRLCERIFTRARMDASVASFLRNFLKVAAEVLLVIFLADYLGFETGSLVAVIGSAGLAVGLALQGSLSNLAGGVLLLLLKPFRVGDYIIACGNEGTVTGMDIFYTRLLTVDNQMVVIPNGTLSNSSITNVTNEPKRRLDIQVGISYDQDIKKVKEVLESVLAGETDPETGILPEEERKIFVSEFGSSEIVIELRVWVATANYWPLKWTLLEKIKYAFDENHIEIPYSQLDVHWDQKA